MRWERVDPKVMDEPAPYAQPSGWMAVVTVLHDDDCRIWDPQAQECSCEPDFKVERK